MLITSQVSKERSFGQLYIKWKIKSYWFTWMIQTFLYQSQVITKIRILIFCGKRSKADLIMFLYKILYPGFPSSIFNFWECKLLIYLLYYRPTVHLSARYTFREMWSFFEWKFKPFVSLCVFILEYTTLWFWTYFSIIDLYQYLYFLYKVGDGIH